MSKSTTVSISKSIYEEYFHYDEIHSRVYGESTTCILMEVGSFFEIYTYKDNTNGKIAHPKTSDISTICNLNLVEKKTTYRTNTQSILMMGFRNYMLDKYVHKLTQSNYTVVVYVQEKKGKDILRKLSDIFSKGTFIATDESTEEYSQSHHMICVWMETFSTHKNLPLQIAVGISAIDVCTGHSVMFEYTSPYTLDPTTFDELERFVSTFPPIEIICISCLEETTTRTILKFSGISFTQPIHFYTKENRDQMEKIGNCTKQLYIQNAIETYFRMPGFYLHCNEFQEYAISTQSLCYLLDFIKEHDPNLISKILPPTFSNTTERVTLANHTLRQLNIIEDGSNVFNSTGNNCYPHQNENGKLSSVLSFLNRCKTPMGKRMFEKRLLNPTTNVEWLQREYSIIQCVKQNIERNRNTQQQRDIQKILVNITDIDKFIRKLVTKRILPYSMFTFYNSLCEIEQLEGILKESFAKEKGQQQQAENDIFWEYFYLTNKNSVFLSLEEMKGFFHERFILENCRGVNTSSSEQKNFIAMGVSQELDECITKMQIYQKQYTTIHNILNYWVQNVFDHNGNDLLGWLNSTAHQKKEKIQKSNTEYVKIHQTEKSGMSFQMTKKRATTFNKWWGEHAQMAQLLIDGLIQCIDLDSLAHSTTTHHSWGHKELKIVHSTGTNDEIETSISISINAQMIKTQEKINELENTVYRKILEEMGERFTEHLQTLSKQLSMFDVIFNCASIAISNNYCLPQLDQDRTTKSYLQATKMRHCLIEHLNTSEIYIPNDVTLGIDGQYDGILLYGTNAIGKTSLIRAIGICVIMAQAGMFVPCETFVYQPYQNIFSRIIGNDNLFKGLSTFQVEMNELRVILRNSNENSLILGDEVCSSTELESGLSIILSAFIELHERHCSFIFATHFYEISRFDEMETLPRIVMKHLSVHYDEITGKLVYDRILKDGVGLTFYGLTVCRSMNMPESFMERAFEIHRTHYPETKGVLSLKKTKYNRRKLVGICEMCKKRFSDETHHIHPQKSAEIQNGYINTFHKDHVANLMSVCSKCHKNIHHRNEMEN